MAYPTVRFNLDEGSAPFLASGAGPAPAIIGEKGRNREAASSTRWGFFETTPPDLSEIPTDGSAVLAVDAGLGRNFSRILSVKDTQQTTTGQPSGVTISSMGSVEGLSIGDLIMAVGAGAGGSDLYVTITYIGSNYVYISDAATSSTPTTIICPKQVRTEQSFAGVSTDREWAIGGKLLDPANTSQIFSDLGAGWTIILERPSSGSIYDFSGDPIFLTVAGDLTAGPVRILGENRPTLKAHSAASIIELTAPYYRFGDFEVTDCREAILIDTSSPEDIVFERLSSRGEGITDIVRFTSSATGSRFRVSSCDFRDYSGAAFKVQGALGGLEVEDVFFLSLAGNGIDAQAGIAFLRARDSIFAGGNYGILIGNGTPAILDIERNIFDGLGNGFFLGGALAGARGLILRNNIFSNCSGTALTLPADAELAVGIVDYNNMWMNAVNRSGISAGPNDVSLDPEYWNRTAYDFRVGIALRALGWPDGTYGASALSPTAQDIGSAQRIEPVGGDILARITFLEDLGEDWGIGIIQIGGDEDGQGRMLHVPKVLIPAAGVILEEALVHQVATALRDHAAATLVGKEVQI